MATMTDAVFLIQFLVFVALFFLQLYSLFSKFFDNKNDITKKAVQIKLTVLYFIGCWVAFAVGSIAFLDSLSTIYASLFLIQSIILGLNVIIFIVEVILMWPMIVKLFGSNEIQAHNSKEEKKWN